MNAVDLFAGPGGWDCALKELGVDPLGIEWDDAACATREAAGLKTLQANVAELDPLDVGYDVGGAYDRRCIDFLIASAPCPTYSSAGNGSGRHLTEIVIRCLHELAAGNDTRAERREEAFDVLKPIYEERELEKAQKKKREPNLQQAADRARRDADMSLLVVEPLRWVLALEPRFIALEQVPEVLSLWSVMAEILGALGYNCWTGIMEAERYGVPQIRERAILMASRLGPVHPPQPTHQRYVKGEPQRHEHTFEGEILPWVSMAEALGWRMTERPQYTICGGYSDGGVETYGSGDARRGVEAERDRGAFKLRNGNQENAAVRDEGEPAPTIHFGKNCNEVVWINEHGEPEELAACGCFIGWVDADGFCACCQAHLDDPDGLYAIQGDGTHGFRKCPSYEPPIAYDRRQAGGDGTPVPPVPTSEPAPTLTAAGLAKGRDQWTRERPAPTIVTTRRSKDGIVVGRQLPEGEGENVGGHGWDSEGSESKPKAAGDAVRVSLEEAAILQSFPPDYPFQGTKSQRLLQVGNAVPPLLAKAILTQLLSVPAELERSAA